MGEIRCGRVFARNKGKMRRLLRRREGRKRPSMNFLDQYRTQRMVHEATP
jgi:hypothetical protein